MGSSPAARRRGGGGEFLRTELRIFALGERNLAKGEADCANESSQKNLLYATCGVCFL
jgi:hypothetical protein